MRREYRNARARGLQRANGKTTHGGAGKWRGAGDKKISRAEIPSGARHNRANDAGERYPANYGADRS